MQQLLSRAIGYNHHLLMLLVILFQSTIYSGEQHMQQQKEFTERHVNRFIKEAKGISCWMGMVVTWKSIKYLLIRIKIYGLQSSCRPLFNYLKSKWIYTGPLWSFNSIVYMGPATAMQWAQVSGTAVLLQHLQCIVIRA